LMASANVPNPRLAQQQMHVLRHDHVSIDVELVAFAHTFQRRLEGLAGGRRNEQRSASVTAEGDEM
jgi:hypothetical protein